jgi:hypothetical protein
MRYPSIRRAARVLICAAALPCAARSAQEPVVEPAQVAAASEIDWDGRVLAALARAAAPGTRAARETAAGLAGFGEPIVPALLRALVERRALDASGDSLALDEARLAVLRDAVEQLGRPALVAAAEAALAAHAEFPTPERLPPHLEGIALCGRSSDMLLALDLAQASEMDDLALLAAQRGLERAMRAVAGRDAGALRELRKWVARASPTMDLALVRGAASCGRAEALRALVDLFGEDPRLLPTLLGELPRAAQGAARPLDESLLSKLRDILADVSAPPERVRAALRATAALGDAGALPEMIERLRSEDARVRTSAAEALRELTGLLYGEQADTWAGWLAAEQAWFARELPELQARLGARDRGEALDALRRIGQHRYRRDELALIAVEALAHDGAQVRMEAIGCAAVLRSPAALPRLREQLGARSEREDAALRACILHLGGEVADPLAARVPWHGG